ncbi:hypothetical protein NQ176_g5986 [Zarea fungicola]|uniref:Uncharacterized protein n=1 Tax=Zarea fungicola TaxID=93591 RepID=A0ACC1N6N3_9HYPO|nr:hypothetical protein NQ176_g5986 [Lecanicillium fungicola]
MRQFSDEVLLPRIHAASRVDGRTVLPLSSDHLIPLIQFNAFRATLTNLVILSTAYHVSFPCDIGEVLRATPLYALPSSPPPSLIPTALQRAVPHDNWIDLLPDPIMRDNAMRNMHLIQPSEICGDMLGYGSQGQNTIEMTGVLVWGDPWDPAGWEMTEGFLKRWGFLLKGCERTLSATNYWRAQRGDEPLVYEVL